MKVLLFTTFTLLVLNLFAQEYGLRSAQEFRLESTVSEIKATGSDPNDLWQSFPLYGGEMTSIAMNPENRDIIFVGTRDAGVFKTTNGGQTWFPARNGLTFHPIRCMTLDPENPQVIYAGTDNDGIWKTTNGGDNWNKTPYPGSLIVFNILIHPQNPQVVFAGSAGGVGLGIGSIYKSSDGGETWEVKDQGIPHENNSDYTNGIFSLAMECSNPDTLYAGTNYIGVYRTTNGGESWTSFSDSIVGSDQTPDILPSINAIATNPFKPGEPGALLEGKYYFFNGNYWKKVNSGYDDYVGEGIHAGRLYYHPEDSMIVYTKRKYSSDAGQNWDDLVTYSTEEERHFIVDLVFPETDMQTIIAAAKIVFDTKGGVIKSSNQGNSWEYTSEGITAQTIYSVAVDRSNPDNICTGTGDGHFFSSDDGGLTWERGYYYIWYQDEDSNQKSFNFDRINSIAIDPIHSNEIYIAAFSRLYKSVDGGRIFTEIDSVRYPECIVISSHPTTTIYVGGSFGQGIKKSVDGGATWESKNCGLPESFFGSILPVTSITIDPNNPSVVWAGIKNGGGIMRSYNGGDHWIEMGLTKENTIRAIAINPDNSNEIIVSTTESLSNKIYRSDDGGEIWQLVISDIAAVKEFVYDPRDSGQIYAATAGYGMMRSIDGGETWDLYNEGIFYPTLYGVEITTEMPPKLVAGSYGSGLYWTIPSMPVRSFKATTVSKTEIDLTWALNINSDKVMVAWSADEHFGKPLDSTGYSSGSSIAGGGTVIYVGTGTGFNHTSLLPGSYNYYKAWTQASDGKYSSGEKDAAYTLCEIAFPYTEDFYEGILPDCWETIDHKDQGYSWQFNNPGERALNSTTGDNGFAIFDYEHYGIMDSMNTSLLSPLFDFSPFSSVHLKFEHCFKGFVNVAKAYLLYSPDNGITWLMLNSWETSHGTETSPALYSRDISGEVAGSSYVLFKWNYSGRYGDYWMIDDVEITTAATGIENIEEIEATFYPNPSDGLFELRLNKTYKTGELKVVDLSGNVLFHIELNSNQHTINLSSFAPGVYIAQVIIDNKPYYKKLICK